MKSAIAGFGLGVCSYVAFLDVQHHNYLFALVFAAFAVVNLYNLIFWR